MLEWDRDCLWQVIFRSPRLRQRNEEGAYRFTARNTSGEVLTRRCTKHLLLITYHLGCMYNILPSPSATARCGSSQSTHFSHLHELA